MIISLQVSNMLNSQFKIEFKNRHGPRKASEVYVILKDEADQHLYAPFPESDLC